MKNTLKKARNKIIAPLADQLKSVEKELVEAKHEIGNLWAKIDRYTPRIMPISERLIVVKIFSGLKICLDPTDVAVVPHLALDGIWEEGMTKAWLSVLKPDQTVLDIGANFGYYGLLAAQRSADPAQKIIFFEPNPDLIPYIERTLSINGLTRHNRVENLGVAEKNGIATLTILKDYIGCSSLHSADHLDSYLHDKMKVEVDKTVKVKTVTVDHYCEDSSIKKADLIKLDIEGYEDQAYAGMAQIVKSSPNMILFLEFTRQSYSHPKEFYAQLRADFKYVYTINEIDGTLENPPSQSYKDLIGDSGNFFMMLVFSKKPLV